MNGVVILALKKPSYCCAAFNLALSIKYHNPKIHITLISDGEHKNHFMTQHYAVFDWIKEIKLCDYIDKDGIFQPALAKINIHKYSTYDNSLYIDADSICIQDIQPLFDKLQGSDFKSNLIDGYTQWTDEDAYKSFFGLPFGKTINTSWIYWQNDNIFRQANEFYINDFPKDKINPKWGGTYPDELFFNASINKLNIEPQVKFDVMFFGNNIDLRTLDKIEEDFYFFTLYGNRTTVRKIYVDFYDKLLYKICASKGLEHRFKAHAILTGKHVNK